MSDAFEILGENQVLDHPYLKLSVITARDPRGNEFDALLGTGPDLVYIVPLWPDDTVTLIRTHRIGFEKTCIEVPGGHVNSEEALRNAALRELREETGLEAAEVTPLFTCMLSGKIQQHVHLFVAENLTPGEQQLDTGEELVPLRMPFVEALRLATSGEIQQGMSVLALLAAARHIEGS